MATRDKTSSETTNPDAVGRPLEWQGWMIFKRKGNQIGLVQSSFSLSKDGAEMTLKARGRSDEEVLPVRLVLI